MPRTIHEAAEEVNTAALRLYASHLRKRGQASNRPIGSVLRLSIPDLRKCGIRALLRSHTQINVIFITQHFWSLRVK